MRPSCPNHNVSLDVKKLTDLVGTCPISGALFTFEAKPETERLDKFGKKLVDYKVVGND